MDLLGAWGRFEHQVLRLGDDAPPVRDVDEAWAAWQTWTRRLATYLDRVASGREGTRRPVPEALHRLLTGGKEGDDADPSAR